MEDKSGTKLTRRGLMIAGAGTAAAIATPFPSAAKPEASGAVQVSTVSFQVNGQQWTRAIRPPDESHAMMEPHASLAAWDGDKLTLWTSSQMIAWAVRDLGQTFLMPPEKIRVLSPYIGGGFGAKLRIQSDAVLAALGARAAGRPVKVALSRTVLMNNSVHRPETRQRIRIGTTSAGKITAIAHESWSGNLACGRPETAVGQLSRYLWIRSESP